MTDQPLSSTLEDSRFNRFDDELIDTYFNEAGKQAIRDYIANQVEANTPTSTDDELDEILHIELKDYGTKVLKLIDVNEAKAAIKAHTDRKVAEALEASRDIARDVDYRNLPIGTKLKSKRTGNTVEVVDRAFYYGLRHHFDAVDNRKEQEDYSSNHWEDVKGWFDVTEVPKNNSAQLTQDTKKGEQ